MKHYRKKVIASTCLVALFLFSGAKIEAVQNAVTPGDITLIEDDRVVPPIEPGEEGEIEEVHPPTKGPLSLSYASDWDFGKRKVRKDKQVFEATKDTITNKQTNKDVGISNFVQLTDLRGGAKGWVLSVRQNGPLTSQTGETVGGAKITVSATSIQSENAMTGIPKNLEKNVELVEGQVHPVVRADKKTGFGTWTVFFGEKTDNKNAPTLTVPKNEPKTGGKYTTTLTWFLQDVL